MSRLNYIEKRNKLRRKVMQGFPWNGKFKTKEEIYNYFSGDRVQCLLCGKWFQVLHSHLRFIHDINSDEYRETYGLPWKHGLCGKEVSLKLSKTMKKRRENGFRPDIDAARGKTKQVKQRQDQAFFTRVRSDNIISGNKKRQKYFHEDFQNVLIRMLEENKTLVEACKDPDMPIYGLVYKYAVRNKNFRKALDETYEKLSFSVQARALKLSEDKFRKAIISLRQSGFSVPEISRYLGVSENMIRRRLKLT